MKKVLLVLVLAFTAIGCESIFEPNDPAVPVDHKMPRVGSSFTFVDPENETATFTVEAYQAQHMGRDSVMQVEVSNEAGDLFIDIMQNDDVSFIPDDLGIWVNLPVASRRAITHPTVTKETPDGKITYDITASPLGTDSIEIKGKNHYAIISRLRTLHKVVDRGGQVITTREFDEEYYWVPSIGFFGQITTNEGAIPNSYDLVDYALR